MVLPVYAIGCQNSSGMPRKLWKTKGEYCEDMYSFFMNSPLALCFGNKTERA
jgi:hypothetical protein